MPINPYFKFLAQSSEQQLLESLIVEAIEDYGLDIMYLPRELQKEDLILGEDVLSKFTTWYEMPMFIKVFDRFGGEGDFLSKFGQQVEDTASIIVAASVFDIAVQGNYPYPREGDLLYFPLNNVMMEIKFVEDEPTFYHLGKQYMFELRCEMFRYTNEKIVTGEPEIDNDYVNKLVYAIDLQLGTGTGTFLTDEIVYQGTTLVSATQKAQVISWNATTKKLRVKYTIGEFAAASGNIKGETSGASWTLTSIDTKDNVNEKRADNKNLETEAQDIVDWSESNPFGS